MLCWPANCIAINNMVQQVIVNRKMVPAGPFLLSMTPQADALFLLAPMTDSGSGIKTCCLITDTITRSSKSHVLATCTLVSQDLPSCIHVTQADVCNYMKEGMHWFSSSQQCCIADLEFQKAFNTNVNGQSMVDHLLALVAQQLQVSIPLQHERHWYVLQCITETPPLLCNNVDPLVKLLLLLVCICTVGNADAA